MTTREQVEEFLVDAKVNGYVSQRLVCQREPGDFASVVICRHHWTAMVSVVQGDDACEIELSAHSARLLVIQLTEWLVELDSLS